MATKIGDTEIAFAEHCHEFPGVWTTFGRETKVLPKGWTKDPGRRPLPIDLLFDKDIPIKLRDGTVLPYGKTGSGALTLDTHPFRVGIPLNGTSGLEKFEAPDPAEWCPRGYAVVNVDARGTWNSEGDFYVYGTQEARDGYDTIEWIGTQPWCNGNVALYGNSWLGTTQWLIAAEKPPHLKALAPWEGLGDYYRESICRGGIPDHAFWDLLFQLFGGKNRREDVGKMVDTVCPLFSAYWDDKRPKLKNIDLPMYVTASYSTGLHTEGSLRGFFLSSSKEKWLRFCSTQEWHDIYQPKYIDEAQKFFDYYLKGIKNDWPSTPYMRLSLLGYNRPSVVDRVISSYPPPEFRIETLYLDAGNGALADQPKADANTVSYQANDKDDQGVSFVHKFDKYTELTGFARTQLYMSTPDSDDFDVYVVVRKLDKNGSALHHFNIPFKDLPPGTTEDDIPRTNVYRYVGPNGRLRASHRKVIDEPGYTPEQRALLSGLYLWHPHDKEEKIPAGTVVPLDIGLWAGGMIFDAGESLMLHIKGSLPIEKEFDELEGRIVNHNVGKHTVHTGKDHPSSLKVYLSQSG
ncbi:Alpha/Beta hydrolase protein [Dactylonectria macrodidyma]|uniref:Alpha/Beta hydrolase protein n=1 Tax=Dactylonectria macrodidyma TaxID=307937 RepID=A0A9P9D749_9HYPO|nr:Alpha/Beta hydrolase protein [Dactylonectria macrodidyma]